MDDVTTGKCYNLGIDRRKNPHIEGKCLYLNRKYFMISCPMTLSVLHITDNKKLFKMRNDYWRRELDNCWLVLSRIYYDGWLDGNN